MKLYKKNSLFLILFIFLLSCQTSFAINDKNEVDIIKNSVIDATEAYVEARLSVLDFVKTQIGVVIDDYIILFDPSYIHNTYYYNASIPSPVKLEDYLSEEARYYDNSRKTQRISNGILKDNIVEEYLYYSNLYCNILNHYSDNYKVLKNIVQRIDYEWYLEDLQREIRYNELVRKK